MYKKVYCLLFTFVVLIFGSCSDKSDPILTTNKIVTNFSIIADRTGLHEEGVYSQVIAKSLETNSEFLIDVGDMIEGGTEQQIVLDTHWNEYLNLISNVDKPFYHTPGNHDLWFPGQMEHYLHYIGNPYFSFNINNIHFVILDNSRWTPDSTFYLSRAQMIWLNEDLKNNTQQFTFVFCHRPFWDKSINDSTIRNNSLHSFLLSNEVDVVVAGHYHAYFEAEYDGMKYVIAGRSGGATTLGHPYFTPKDVRYEAPLFEDHRFLNVTVDDSIHIESRIVQIE